MKIPNSKSQTPKKLQIANSNADESLNGILKFGAWSFFGVWNLEFGVS
jgi:hypothetical protein